MTGRLKGLYKIRDQVECLSRCNNSDSLETINILEVLFVYKYYIKALFFRNDCFSEG